MQQIRVFIATQHQTLHEGLSRLLETEVISIVVGSVVGRIPTEDEIKQTGADLLILDIRLLPSDRLEHLAQEFSHITLVLYAEADLMTITRYLLNVEVCTPRSLDSEELLGFIRRLHSDRQL